MNPKNKKKSGSSPLYKIFKIFVSIGFSIGLGILVGYLVLNKSSSDSSQNNCIESGNNENKETCAPLEIKTCPVPPECPEFTSTPCPEVTFTPCPVTTPSPCFSVYPMNMIYAKDPATCLDLGQWKKRIGSSTKYGLYPCDPKNNNQKFEFIKSPVSSSTERVFQIKSVSSGKCLDNSSGGDWNWLDCKNSSDPSQLFRFNGKDYTLGLQRYISSGTTTPIPECLDNLSASQKSNCDVGNLKNQQFYVWNHTV